MGNAQQVGALLGKKEFPYDIEENFVQTSTLWKIHKARRKSDQELVTIFKFDFDTTTSPDKIELAKASLKRLRAIKHPGVVNFLDGVELPNSICIVTEYVTPLSIELQNIRIQLGAPEIIAYGLYQIAKVLSFLHGKNMYHCNVNMDSVFVDVGGDWKIGELGFLTSFQNNGVVNPTEASYGVPVRTYGSYIMNKYKSLELTTQRWDIIEESPSKLDSWGLACLIYEIFEGNFNNSDDLKRVSKIPKTLRVGYDQLIDKNVKMRLDATRLLENPYFKNSLIEIQIFLENITIKDAAATDDFLTRLPDMLTQIPQNNLKNKVLPSLIQLIKFTNNGQKAIIPIMKLGTLLNEDDFKNIFIPKIIDLFEIADRTVRVNLLKSIDHIAMYLSPEQSEAVYEHVSKGFRDTSPVLREMTVKAMIPLVPKLKEDTVDNNVVRFMWALQGDKENAIRTNTVIAFGKLAGNFSERTRKKVLLAAFVRSLKDPFVHSRVAALKALLSTKSFYSVSEVAVKGLPFVVSLTVDAEKQVRDLAFQVMNEFLKVISDLSENPNFTEIVNNERHQDNAIANGGQTGSATSGSGEQGDYLSWAMKSIKTKVLGENEQQGSNNQASKPLSSPSLANSSSNSGYGSSTQTTVNNNTSNNASSTIYKPVSLNSTPKQNSQEFNTLQPKQPVQNNTKQPVQSVNNTANTAQKKQPVKSNSNNDFDDFFDMDDMPSGSSNTNSSSGNMLASDDLLDGDWSSWDMDSQFETPKPKTNNTSSSLKLSHNPTTSSPNQNQKKPTTQSTNTISSQKNNNNFGDDFFSSMNEPQKKQTPSQQPTLQPSRPQQQQQQPIRQQPPKQASNNSVPPQKAKDWSDNWEEW